PAVVAVPAIVMLAVSGHSGAAIGLAVWYVVFVVGLEHLAKPFILRATSGGEMHTGLMFLALLGGLEVFGLLGVILGPLIVSFFVSLMRTLERDGLGDGAERAAVYARQRALDSRRVEAGLALDDRRRPT